MGVGERSRLEQPADFDCDWKIFRNWLAPWKAATRWKGLFTEGEQALPGWIMCGLEIMGEAVSRSDRRCSYYSRGFALGLVQWSCLDAVVILTFELFLPTGLHGVPHRPRRPFVCFHGGPHCVDGTDRYFSIVG